MDYYLSDLRREVSKATKIKQKDVELVLRTAFEKIGDQLAQGNKVYLIDFFNFEPHDYRKREVKNPRTGEPLTIKPYRSVRCKPTRAMKKKLQSNFTEPS